MQFKTADQVSNYLTKVLKLITRVSFKIKFPILIPQYTKMVCYNKAWWYLSLNDERTILTENFVFLLLHQDTINIPLLFQVNILD